MAESEPETDKFIKTLVFFEGAGKIFGAWRLVGFRRLVQLYSLI